MHHCTYKVMPAVNGTSSVNLLHMKLKYQQKRKLFYWNDQTQRRHSHRIWNCDAPKDLGG